MLGVNSAAPDASPLSPKPRKSKTDVRTGESNVDGVALAEVDAIDIDNDVDVEDLFQNKN